MNLREYSQINDHINMKPIYEHWLFDIITLFFMTIQNYLQSLNIVNMFVLFNINLNL